ncbi:MAG: DUF1622 domain-containing protein [Hyphomicrobium sp.]|nr:DUF1622 domain-containing protein [Hyphomicrobium sp.]
MEEGLLVLSRAAVLVIDGMALAIVAFGSAQAFFAVVRLLVSQSTEEERQKIWLRYARWLVAGLTFQLAADIIETANATSWEAIARLGSIAAIRTFLNYFLERDMAETRTREEETKVAARAPNAHHREVGVDRV